MSAPRDPEQKALDAYRDLGVDLSELRSAIIASELLESRLLKEEVGRQLFRGPTGFTVYALNKDETDALTYMRFHIGDLSRRLVEKFDGIEGGA